MREKRKKVGRPRLADKGMKKESIMVCIFNLTVLIAFAVIGFNILTIDINPKYLIGTIYNDHIDKCVIDGNRIDCGPKVSYIKYTTDNKNYNELTKKDESLKVKIADKTKVKFCYKTSIEDSKCTE